MEVILEGGKDVPDSHTAPMLIFPFPPPSLLAPPLFPSAVFAVGCLGGRLWLGRSRGRLLCRPGGCRGRCLDGRPASFPPLPPPPLLS